MELVQELLLTAFVAVLLSFLVAKLVSIAVAGDVGPGLVSKEQKSAQSRFFLEEVNFVERLQVEGCRSERRSEFVGEYVKTVDMFGEDPAQIDRSAKIIHRAEQSEEERLLDKPIGEKSETTVFPGKSPALKSEFAGFLPSSSIAESRGPENLQVQTSVEEQKVVGISGIEEVKGDNSNPFPARLGSSVDDTVLLLDKNEVVRALTCAEKGKSEEEEGLSGEDDDWEGIERSALEKDFAAAATYLSTADHEGRMSSIGHDVQMLLYGLHKVAMEGSCREPQPMALKVSARAKWNAWQQLGNMSPEVAMAQYITLISDKFPEWKKNPSPEEWKRSISVTDSDSSTSVQHQRHCASANAGCL